MSTPYLVFILVSAILLLLVLIMKFKVNAFLALLLIAVYTGIVAGMPLQDVAESIQTGMGSTLGFVAVVVGLGAIFGQMLESSGGAEALASHLLKKFGNKHAPWALTLTGFVIAIPVFFDVGFIIMVPMLYALSRDTKKSLLFFGIPLLAGLAVTHSFIPPTPGPVAVAEIIDVPLGWVIIFGFILGLPVAILAGPVFGKFIAKKIYVPPPDYFPVAADPASDNKKKKVGFGTVILLIGVPLLLIVFNTTTNALVQAGHLRDILITDIIIFCGHPFTALIIANLLAIYFLGIRLKFTKDEIRKMTTKSLGPAGIIILITGAGGVLKQVLIESGIGEQIAHTITESNISPILLGWILAAIVRVTQGSATVAMITAAGLLAPVLDIMAIDEMHRALTVLSIASGATILSHVNDSGFWLIGQYFGLNEKQTLQSWTIMETIIAVSGLIFCLLAGKVVSLF